MSNKVILVSEFMYPVEVYRRRKVTAQWSIGDKGFPFDNIYTTKIAKSVIMYLCMLGCI